MKKTFLSMGLIATLVLSMSGCSAKPAEPTAPAAPAETAAKTKITLGMQADSAGGIQKVIEAFKQKYPQYDVEFANMTNDSAQMHDQLLNSLSSKSSQYDVLAMDVVWGGEFASAGYLQPMDELMMANNWKPTDFNAGSMASGKYQGKNYALPYFPDLGFLYFRSDIVSKEDADKLKSGNYSWDDLKALSEKYSGKNGTKYGIVYQSKQYEGLVCNLNEFTANWTDIEGGLKTMKAFTESKAVPKDLLVYTEGETHAAFLNGDSVFARNWPYMYGMIKNGKDSKIKVEQVDFAPLPKGGTVGGWLLGINKFTKNQKGAEDFVTFLAGEEGQKILASTNGSLPGINKLQNDPDLAKLNPMLASESFRKAVSSTISRPVVPNYSQVSDKIQIAAHAYLSGSKDLASATKEIQDALKK